MKKVLLLCSILSFLKISQADVNLSEYTDNSGLTCKAIVITDDFIAKAEIISEEVRELCATRLQKIIKLIASAQTDMDYVNAAGEISGSLCLFKGEGRDLLEDIYLNLQMRAALMGNSTAIYEIMSLSSQVRKESLEKELYIARDTYVRRTIFIHSPKNQR